MSWHYQIFKKGGEDNICREDEYGIKEYYPSTSGITNGGWTVDDMAPHGTTRDELIRDLALMLHDALTMGVRDSATGELIEK